MTEATPLDPAVAEALAQLRGYRLPETTRFAHKAAGGAEILIGGMGD